MSKSLRNQLIKMHTENPRCTWCLKKTILIPLERLRGMKGKTLPPRMATIDHLYSRLDPLRYKQPLGIKSHVLACRRCNLKRSHIDMHERIEVQKLKSLNVKCPECTTRMVLNLETHKWRCPSCRFYMDSDKGLSLKQSND